MLSHFFVAILRNKLKKKNKKTKKHSQHTAPTEENIKALRKKWSETETGETN